MKEYDVAIAGLGPSGAYALYKIAQKGYRAVGYDVARRYMKACGDAVPWRSVAGSEAEKAGAVVDEVNFIEVRVAGQRVAEASYQSRVWYIIDKSMFVGDLRERAVAEGASIEWGAVRDPASLAAGVRVDARGPYSRLRDTIVVYRAIMRAPGWPKGYAVIDFDLERVGFYWVFPAGDGLVNAGAGWLGCRDCIDAARSLVSDVVGGEAGRAEVVDERAAPLALTRPPIHWNGSVLLVGEAAGVVVSLSGEGIRPGLETGDALAEAVARCGARLGCVRRVYGRLFKTVAARARLSRKLLGLVAKAPPRVGERLIKSIPEKFWLEFFEGRLDLGMLVSSGLKRPVLALRVVRALLSSRS